MALVKNASAIALSAAAAAMLTLTGCGSSSSSSTAPAVDTTVNPAVTTAGNLNVHEDDNATCGGVVETAVWKGKKGSNDPLEQ